MPPIIDLHCHPCLKIYLFNKEISRNHHPMRDLLPTGMHVDLPGMRAANVQVACCYHYIPEYGFETLRRPRFVFDALKKLRPNFIDKFEPVNEDDGAIERAHLSFDMLNNQIEDSAPQFNVTIAKNLAEFTDAIDAHKTIILHCLEGSHHLGKNFSPNEYIKRLEEFKSRGLCILTLGHFFPNAICDSAGGIPPSTAKLLGYSKPMPISSGLSQAGEKVVEWCLQNGVIIDLVHSTVETRKKVYAILESRRQQKLKDRPVIFSHSGVRELAAPNMKNEDDKMILPDATELTTIKEYGGVIGLILMNYWLVGIEEDNIFKNEGGLDNILKTIEFIKDTLGDFENIAFGTDLDGFSQVPDDVFHVRLLGKVRQAIINKFGNDAAKKICYENALNVIKNGWS